MSNRKTMDQIHGLGGSQEPGPAPAPLPHNLAAEAAVLGALLFDNAVFKPVAEILEPDHFYAPAHQHLFEVISTQIAAGMTADGVTLQEHFSAEGKLSEIGGADYLLELIDGAAFGPEVRDYAWIVRDLWTRRALIHFGGEVQTDARLMPAGRDGQAAASEAGEKLDRIMSHAGVRVRTIESAKDVMTGFIGRIRERLDAGLKLPCGMSTGLPALDDQLSRMVGGDLIILAGRPSMGKTALALHIVHNSKRPVDEDPHQVLPARAAFFSLEMSDEPLSHRVMSMSARQMKLGKVPYRNIRKGLIGQNEAAILDEAVRRLPDTIAWHTAGKLSLAAIESGSKQAARRLGGLDLIVIDYLQLIELESRWGDNKSSAIGAVTGGLKALAKELNVPVICLSQLSRAVEQRENKRPYLSDLRESGDIEQDADAVIFIYREEYYLAKEEPRGVGFKDPKWNEWQDKLRNCAGVVELDCAKVRQGAVGMVRAYVELETNCVVSDKSQLGEEVLL